MSEQPSEAELTAATHFGERLTKGVSEQALALRHAMGLKTFASEEAHLTWDMGVAMATTAVIIWLANEGILTDEVFLRTVSHE